jgi:DNA-directed RNA polymerase sigma subunit (sigma70/sigma32)
MAHNLGDRLMGRRNATTARGVELTALALRAKAGDREALEEMGAHVRGLTLRLAQRWGWAAIEDDDLIGIGGLALMDAIRRHDETRKCEFATTFGWALRARVVRYLSWGWHPIRLPANLRPDASGTVPTRPQILPINDELPPAVRGVTEGPYAPEILDALDRAIDSLPAEERTVIRARLARDAARSRLACWAGPATEVGKGRNRLAQIESRAMRRLRIALRDLMEQVA